MISECRYMTSQYLLITFLSKSSSARQTGKLLIDQEDVLIIPGIDENDFIKQMAGTREVTECSS